jgi:hypothetical protein
MTDQTKENITLPACPFDFSSPVDYDDISDSSFENTDNEAERQQLKTEWDANKV